MTRTIRIFRCKYTKRVIVSLNGKNLNTFETYDQALKHVSKSFYSNYLGYGERIGTLISIVDLENAENKATQQ